MSEEEKKERPYATFYHKHHGQKLLVGRPFHAAILMGRSNAQVNRDMNDGIINFIMIDGFRYVVLDERFKERRLFFELKDKRDKRK